MGWPTIFFSTAFLGYFTYNFYQIWNTIQPPFAHKFIENFDSNTHPDLAYSLYSKNDKLGYEIFVSSSGHLPGLKEMLDMHQKSMEQKTAQVFHVGSITPTFYNFDDLPEISNSESTESESRSIISIILDPIIGIYKKIISWRVYLDAWAGNVATIHSELPDFFQNNSTLYIHVIATDEKMQELPLRTSERITSLSVPEHHKHISRFLLQDITGEILQEKLRGLQVPGPPIFSLPKFILVGPVIEHGPLYLPKLVQVFSSRSPFLNIQKRAYQLPIFISADISPRDEHIPLIDTPLDQFSITPKPPLDVQIMYQPVGYAYWFLQLMLTNSFALLQQKFHFDEYDTNSLKMATAIAAKKNSFVALAVLVIFSVLHCLLELLSIQSDIAFWRQQENPGKSFSLRSLLYEVGMEVVVALYLHESDSKLPLVFIVLRILLNLWKIKKFIKIEFTSMFGIRISKKICDSQDSQDGVKNSNTNNEQLDDVEKFEERWSWWLTITIVVPAVLTVTTYQLVYIPQKGWWSWIVKSGAMCCYMLGFVAMTPQLFRNYYMKSVEFMPWRVLFYQFINTFIDDVAACIIRMPKMHQMSVFRDDIIFLIYLYQRWLYRKKPSRIDGDQQEDSPQEKKKK